ncbi:IclR family transcriptional regulator [Rhodococcus opacus]|uniref:IclR family transcriptional regulator n=1 Tax=Rhodococcus opacus TaxID=37919 RepID=UPI0024742B6C|nr:IclR family transcriptional regulator [Rhodococcus opacus]MDH6292486.1 DNA-binding IclR family transcriptional regulator [Rhodococcus opacus]
MALQSVDHALAILQILQEQDEIGVSEAAERLAVAPSTAHRLLTTLVERGFARRSVTAKRYRLGPAMTAARRPNADEDYVLLAHDVLESLEAATHETVHLATLDGTRARYLDVVVSREEMRVPSRVGAQVPAHASSAGKALLASYSSRSINRAYPREQLGVSTATTIANKSALTRELAGVRVNGYARIFAEWEPGVNAIAMPVVGAGGISTVALAVAGPESRFQLARDDTRTGHERFIVHQLRAAAAMLQARLADAGCMPGGQ